MKRAPSKDELAWCPCCGVKIGALPYDWSGRPKLMVCWDCEPPTLLCEACQGQHTHTSAGATTCNHPASRVEWM